jgi:hypothetical protein
MSERTVITIQPANSADGTYDVHEPLPYPFHVDAVTGDVGRQDFWKGAPFRVLGFQKDAAVQQVDLWWEQAAADPDQIVGMFAVMLDTSEGEPHMYNLTHPIASVASTKVDAETAGDRGK